MRLILPKEFKNILEDIRRERNFELLKSTIERLWNVNIIERENPTSQNFYRGLYSQEYHHPFDTGYQIYWIPEYYYLHGIVGYDIVLNRFVVFQFLSSFNYEESRKDLIDGVITGLLSDFKKLKLEKEFVSRLNPNEVNLDLTKLVVVSFEIPTEDLLKYLNRNHPNSSCDRGIELWKITSFEEGVVSLEKVQNDFNQDIDKTKISEKDFFESYKISYKVLQKYYLFKEYLRFNFNCKLETFSGVEREKLYKFYEDILSTEYGDDYIDGPVDLSTKEEVQSFLNDIIQEYRNTGSEPTEDLITTNYLDFCGITVLVNTQGLGFNLSFSFKFSSESIGVSMTLLERETNRIHVLDKRFVITNRTKYDQIHKYVNSVFKVYKGVERKRRIEERIRLKEEKIQKEQKGDSDLIDNLPF